MYSYFVTIHIDLKPFEGFVDGWLVRGTPTHSAYNMFSKYKSHPSFWSGNFFLIAPVPDHCLLVVPSFSFLQILMKRNGK